MEQENEEKKYSADAPLLADFQNLEEYLKNRLRPIKLSLSITNNKFTMISVKREPRLYSVRLHSLFVKGHFLIRDYLSDYIIKNTKESSLYLQEYINTFFLKANDDSNTPFVKSTAIGSNFNLKEIYDEINHKYFENQIESHIFWGRERTLEKKRRSIRLGSYSVEEKMIRIHPFLDHSFVPRYFVAWVIYHEMLHQKYGIQIINGRRQFHSKQFLAEEALFEEYERAKHWERVHLFRFLAISSSL